jgi:hypothetical protein
VEAIFEIDIFTRFRNGSALNPFFARSTRYKTARFFLFQKPANARITTVCAPFSLRV